MEVIWLSFPQFENQEFKKALIILGYQTYGNLEIFRNEEHLKCFHDKILDRATPNWKEIYKGYDAMIQTPPTLYYQEYLKINPDIKFVIEDIDSLTWYKRYKRVIRYFKWLQPLRLFKHSRNYLNLMDKMFYLIVKGDSAPINAQVQYNNFIQEIKTNIPEEQLLFFSPHEGWEPLCQFLNKPIPNKKLPYRNTDVEINKTIGNVVLSIFKKNVIILVLYFGTLIGLITYLLFFYD